MGKCKTWTLDCWFPRAAINRTKVVSIDSWDSWQWVNVKPGLWTGLWARPWTGQLTAITTQSLVRMRAFILPRASCVPSLVSVLVLVRLNPLEYLRILCSLCWQIATCIVISSDSNDDIKSTHPFNLFFKCTLSPEVIADDRYVHIKPYACTCIHIKLFRFIWANGSADSSF